MPGDGIMSGRARGNYPRGRLPVRAMYTVGELAKVMCLDRRTLLRVLQKVGVQLFRAGKLWLVPLSELESKARPIWESIQGAELLREVANAR